MTTKTKKTYKLAPRNTVARFYYRGTHTHPIRRTVLVIEESDTHITGYEIREGVKVRTVQEARDAVRTYKKEKIAKWGDYSRLRMSTKNFMNDPEESTLVRSSIKTMFTEGP